MSKYHSKRFRSDAIPLLVRNVVIVPSEMDKVLAHPPLPLRRQQIYRLPTPCSVVFTVVSPLSS